MIRTLAFGGYRSLHDLKLPLRQLNVVTGANGAGKSNVYRGLKLLVDAAAGELGRALAREGGMPSALWAGPARNASRLATKRRAGPVQGTVRSTPVRLTLGFTSDDFGYELALGLPTPSSSAFGFDAEVKTERIWSRESGERPVALVERDAHTAWLRDADGRRVAYPVGLDLGESVMAQVSEPHRYPVVSMMRESLRGWRFYHQFRCDADSPLRQPQVGSRTPVLAHDGVDLVAALQTIREIGDGATLRDAIAHAFDGATLAIDVEDGRFSAAMAMPGVLRPLRALEWSDRTLRYVCLLAALLTPRPPALLVLNEPESSLHPQLLEPLARAIAVASRASQVIVVSHSETLMAALEAEAPVNPLALAREGGETILEGQGLLDEPAWP